MFLSTMDDLATTDDGRFLIFWTGLGWIALGARAGRVDDAGQCQEGGGMGMANVGGTLQHGH